MNPLQSIADIAISQIGRHEDGSSNAGSQIAAYQAATVLGVPASGAGYPWCCAFVDWVIAEFISKNPGVLSCEDARPRTASVEEFVAWAMKTGQLVFGGWKVPSQHALQAGDIVVFHFPSGNHIGIVTGPGTVTFPTVEGNTSSSAAGSQRNGGEVAAKGGDTARNFKKVSCFIRLAVKGVRV